jgi:hypothetical protein
VNRSPGIVALVDQAEGLARLLGHTLEPWERGCSQRTLLCACHDCGLFAVISVAPDCPRLDGSAIRIECRGKKTRPVWAA